MAVKDRLRHGWRVAVVAIRRPMAPRGRRKQWLLITALFGIVFWQFGFSANSATLDATYRDRAASGVQQADRFVYFLYYLDLFPVGTTVPNPELSEAGARRILAESPGSLVQDFGWTWFAGDRGRIYLFLFDAWLKGAPWNPSVRPFHRLVFTLSLCALFASLWWVRRPLLGGITVLLLGSNPFQLFEVHANENIHGWPITTAILVVAMHVPYFASSKLDRRYRWLLPVATGALVATIRTVRSEPATILASALLSYLLLSGLAWRRRALMSGLLIAAFTLTGMTWNRWFEHKHDEAASLLAKIGGHPFPGPIRQYHHFWHPVWCGLGDFGGNYGYVWKDEAALAYAKPILERKYHEHVPVDDFGRQFGAEEYFDAQKVYKRLPFDIPYYNEVVRDKVLHDIGHHPLWYAGILAKRAWRLLSETTPVRVAWTSHWVTIPMHGLVLLPLAALLFAARSRFLLAFLLFTLSTCLPAMIVYSGLGISYFGIYHIVAAAILLTAIVENVRWWIRSRLLDGAEHMLHRVEEK